MLAFDTPSGSFHGTFWYIRDHNFIVLAHYKKAKIDAHIFHTLRLTLRGEVETCTQCCGLHAPNLHPGSLGL